MKHDTWVVIPAHNEEKEIEEVIKKTKRYVNNIVVVDDGSKDKTYETAKKANVIVLRHVVNLGKGAALKTGCEYAIKKRADYIILMDADAQHNPKEIPNFIKNLNNADIVFGYRKITKHMPPILRFGNWFIRGTINLLFNIKINDPLCGYRAFKSRIYKKIRWNSLDYSIESEMATKAGKRHLKYKEIPIQTIYSDKYKGTTIIDGVKIVLNMLWWRLAR